MSTEASGVNVANHHPVMIPNPVNGPRLFSRLEDIHRARVFSNRGAQVLELEAKLADWLGVSRKQIVAVSNATMGLVAAIGSTHVEHWEVPAWTFPASALAVVASGRELSLVDVNPETWVAQGSGKKSVGIVKVVPFGACFSPDYWKDSGEIIIDAAASLATKPRFLGSMPSRVSVVFSLHATKVIGGGEGGVVVFGDEGRAAFARAFINFGFAGSRESEVLGVNAKMSEYEAAVVNTRLEGWPDEESQWQELVLKRSYWNQKAGLCPIPEALNAINPYWIALFDSERERDAAENRLGQLGIDSRKWWGSGLHRMPAFAAWSDGSFPVVDDLAGRSLGLPFFCGMGDELFKAVGDAIAQRAESP